MTVHTYLFTGAQERWTEGGGENGKSDCQLIFVHDTR